MNYENEIEKIVNFIRNYYRENNLGGAIIGLSGGKNSAVLSGILVKSLGSDKVIGISMPCESLKGDYNDAKIISDYYNFKLLNVDLNEIYKLFIKEIKKTGNYQNKELLKSNINLKPRLRMTCLYYFSSLYTSLTNKQYLVIGSSNACELYVGYFTKGGDYVADIMPLAHLTEDEVIEIGKILNTPEEILLKTSTDGITGLTDEEVLGISYNTVGDFLKGKEIPQKDKEKIIKLHNNSWHKFNIPKLN